MDSNPDLRRGPDGLDALFEAARRAQKEAYAPYSKFKVGAALRAASGRIFSGVNVENAAMIVTGERRIMEILVLGEGVLPILPCGACRQRIREFGDDLTMVYSASARGVTRSFTLLELLPEAFGPAHLAGQ
jgi:cytidine deaminase